jgi:hypothetical protein
MKCRNYEKLSDEISRKIKRTGNEVGGDVWVRLISYHQSVWMKIVKVHLW